MNNNYSYSEFKTDKVCLAALTCAVIGEDFAGKTGLVLGAVLGYIIGTGIYPVPDNNNQTARLYKGEHLFINMGYYSHHGLGDGKGGVIHYSGMASDLSCKSCPVERVSLNDFAKGKKIRVKSYDDSKRIFSRDKAVQRAESRIGENNYSVWNNNCEQFVDWCITGRNYSEQLGEINKFLDSGLKKGSFTDGAIRYGVYNLISNEDLIKESLNNTGQKVKSILKYSFSGCVKAASHLKKKYKQ
ncbi:hypothetical protein GMMP1_360017 [Candidatus Magnetomoraceae bacterium gMMP-1]